LRVSDDNEYLWRQPGTRTTAEQLLDAEIADSKGPYDDAAEERHQRRLRAMRALGAAERTGWRLYYISIAAVVIIIVACLILALSASRAHAKSDAWPCSQCMSGWVDAMTGMCPPRPQCKRVPRR
jgi:hypothetical protein